MTVLLQKVIGFLRLIRNLVLQSARDAQYFGYWDSIRWHLIPLRNQIRYYLGHKQLCEPVELRFSGYEHSIWLRPKTSDYQVFRQVFIAQEYGDCRNLRDVRFIIDCGANIGLASVFFLNLFPDAIVLAVEPDQYNMHVCAKNLQPYGSRTRLLQAGVWSNRSKLKVVPSEFGDGNKWGIKVRSAEGSTFGDIVEGYDIISLLNYANAKRVDLLKIDIEGSELNIFSSAPDQWLTQIRNIVIELHGDDCTRAFFSALEGFDYSLSHRGDLTYCLGLRISQASMVGERAS